MSKNADEIDWERVNVFEATRDHPGFSSFNAWRQLEENRNKVINLRNCDFSPPGGLGVLSESDRYRLLNKADYSGSNFRALGSAFRLNFSDCNVAKCDFTEFYVTDQTKFNDAINLHEAKGLESIRIDGRYRDHDFALDKYKLPRSYFPFCTWEKLRGFGQIPLFGASWTLLALIPLYYAAIQYMNHLVENGNKLLLELYPELGNRLPILDGGSSMLILYLGTISFVIASTLFTVGCPARIKEFSLSEWRDENDKNPIHYYPLTWKRPVMRFVTWLMYWIGIVLVAHVAISKTARTLLFILGE